MNQKHAIPIFSKKKGQIYKLHQGVETGDLEAVAVINEKKYIQHNPLIREGNVAAQDVV